MARGRRHAGAHSTGSANDGRSDRDRVLASWESGERSPVVLGRLMDAWLAGPDGARMLRDLRGHPLIAHALPELAATDGFEQDTPWHPEGDLYLHTTQVTERLAELGTDADLRWMGVLHDLGKPESKWFGPEGNAHYYDNPELGKVGHEKIGARLARSILARLGIDGSRADRITRGVRHHMFAEFSTERGARKFVARVGEDTARDLLVFRQADWESGGDPAAVCERMRALIGASQRPPEREVRRRLSISGRELVDAGIPGPRIGPIISELSARVARGELADDPVALRAAALELHAAG